MSNEEHKMTPNMKLFFTKLLEVKRFVKSKSNKSEDMLKVYEMLDAIIKTTEEKGENT